MQTKPNPADRSQPGDEADLLEAVRRGEESAFERLVVTHGPAMRATALRLLQNEADAGDAVQEAFLGAVRGLGGFKGQSTIGTWLHRITVNAALMKIRSRTRRPECDIHDLLPRFGDGGNHLEPAVSFSDGPDRKLARGERAALVRSCIDKLPERYRTALMLKDIEEMDYGEISRSLGLTLNATRIRIHRARQALRKLLLPHFGESAA